MKFALFDGVSIEMSNLLKSMLAFLRVLLRMTSIHEKKREFIFMYLQRPMNEVDHVYNGIVNQFLMSILFPY